MLAREFRLTDFPKAHFKQISTKFFDMKFTSNDENFSRFGFVVSKKVDTRATVRNKLRRKVRQPFEKIFDNIKGGYDFVVYPKKLSLESPIEEISDQVANILSKENLLNK